MESRLHLQVKATPSFTPVRGGVLQRKCACGGSAGVAGECDECSKQNLSLQRSTRNSDLETRNPGLETQDSDGVPPIVHEVLRSSGQPLDPQTRAFMEPRFGHDFSRVRVHTDPQAAESAQRVNALAYTVGRDVVFGAGEYSPNSDAGKEMIAHELTHVVQQRKASATGMAFSVQTGLRVAPADDPLEQEANAAAVNIGSGEIEVSGSQSAGGLFRLPAPDDTGDSISGGTLPYREATELGDCTRIMGEQSAEFCRQEVLGEQPQPVPPAPPPPPCSPTGLARPDYLTQPGTSTDDFGLTRLLFDGDEPQLQTTRVAGGVRLQETSASLQTITSVYTTTGSFTEGETILVGDQGPCPSARYPLRWRISPDGARKIKEGEIEHCADFQYAFEISLKRYADAVNGLARSGRTFRNQRAAETKVTLLAGVAPANWLNVFQCLVDKSTRRDGARWHTPIARTSPPTSNENCAFAHSNVSGVSLPEVGQHPPSEIIRDCGEGGATGGGRGGG
jgi:hypothetical protein